ncbi:CysZ-like protein [Oceanibacterium hippocampi]|uniref:CysZ-like protein n=1 Tax=Oceanibacterium hippocampi TaxID=745714 RepID=A0A1Y5RIE3_9PROT|nr:CysZ-like protein [Oceanibacterium hippocampi]
MFSAFSRAIAQISDPAFRSVLLKSLGLTLLVLILLAVGSAWGIAALPEFETGWLNWIVEAVSALGFVIATIFLFPAIASLAISLFLDDIAEAVERKHYPSAPPGKPLDFGPALILGLKFTGLVILANILALPLYLLPGINIILFYVLNGYLIGREYFELVGWRHMAAEDVRHLRKANQTSVFLTGMAIAFLLTVPLVNLLAPIIATATMVHLFMTMRERAGTAVRPL